MAPEPIYRHTFKLCHRAVFWNVRFFRQQSIEKSCLRTRTVSGGVRVNSSVGPLSFLTM